MERDHTTTEGERKATLLASVASPPSVNAAAPREPQAPPPPAGPPPSRRKTKRKKNAKPSSNAKAPPPIRGPPMAFSVAAFCEAHHISQAMFFKMRNEGFGPDEMRVGTRVLISHEAAARWRLAREQATVAAQQQHSAAKVDTTQENTA
jgi:hypothetical protein